MVLKQRYPSLLFSPLFGVKWSQRTSCSLHEPLQSHWNSCVSGGTVLGISQTPGHMKQGNKPRSLGAICHENNGVVSAPTVPSPSSLACAIPGPTAVAMMHWKDSFLRLGTGTGGRKKLREGWARCWCEWAGTAIHSALTSTPCCSVTTHFAEVIFHCHADAHAIQSQIFTLVSLRAAWICSYCEPEMTSRKHQRPQEYNPVWPTQGDASRCLPSFPLRHACNLIISHLLPFQEKRCLLRSLDLKSACYGKNTLPMLSAPKIVWIGLYVTASTA